MLPNLAGPWMGGILHHSWGFRVWGPVDNVTPIGRRVYDCKVVQDFLRPRL